MSIRCHHLLLLLLTLLLLSCKERGPVEHSFYYWRNSSEASHYCGGQDSLVSRWKLNHLYIRFMDVNWSAQLGIPVPGSGPDFDFRQTIPEVARYTPVIFISNRVFERISDDWCDHKLAEKIRKNIDNLYHNRNFDPVSNALYKTLEDSKGKQLNEDTLQQRIADSMLQDLAEVQIDCDWTARTRDKYFRFLRSMKKQFPKQSLSVTIRLYPYKYPDKMGVPPADKGMLMCYNMGNINKPETVNSIFDLKELKRYLGAKAYKLPLDIALPVFGWYVWFRGQNLKGIVYKNELSGNALNEYCTKTDVRHYRLQQDYAVGERLLREGDMLREEYPDPAELEAGARLLKDHFPNVQRITFFHWNQQSRQQYDTTIQKIYDLY